MARIEAPKNGVKIRMYRQGHGDCFLLTMRQANGEPFYLLIDCGFKPGSEIKEPIEAVIADIREATGAHLHVLMVTHEHQDHVNMFLAKLDGKLLFDAFKVDTLWFGWTADRKDKLASEIREAHKKAVHNLMEARSRLALSLDEAGLAEEIDDLLAFEGFGAAEAAARNDASAVNSKATISSKSVAAAMEYVFARVKKIGERKYFRPHEEPHEIPDVPRVRVYALGPPRSRPDLNLDEPTGEESTERLYQKPGHGLSFSFGGALDGLFGAAGLGGASAADPFRPFAGNKELTRDAASWAASASFFDYFYPEDPQTAPQDDWRRVDMDWLFAAEWFARKINVEVNNSSAVIAIELGQTGKVLLFPGDAQYGNWISWTDQPIPLGGGAEISVKELLARTVFYKVGHHGSHNATLKGQEDSNYANLDWLGQGEFAGEFVAAIPANEPWAYAQVTKRSPDGWQHPLKAIRHALDQKAAGRVFQSDIDFGQMKRPRGSDAGDWNRFVKRARGSTGQNLYFDYWVPDE